MKKAELENKILDAFADVAPPPEWAIVRGHEGSEPVEIERIFSGKKNWREVHLFQLDAEPALAFFSDEAFRYYFQAYLIYDLDGSLNQNNVVLHLTNGFANEDRYEQINPRRYGDRTRWDNSVYRFSTFTKSQAEAVVDFLEYKLGQDDIGEYYKVLIMDALKNYWLPRIGRQG